MTSQSSCSIWNSSSKLSVMMVMLWLMEKISCLGSMGSIAASYGDEDPLFCAIEATGEQQVFCWGRNSTDAAPWAGPSLLGLSGGGGFMCGLKAGEGANQPFCWRSNLTSINIVPSEFQSMTYTSIAAGDGHVCAAKADSPGTIDCWNGDELMEPVPALKAVDSLVAGRRFTCALETENGEVHCWGDGSYGATMAPADEKFDSISAGGNHVCGIIKGTKQIRCWGDNRDGQAAGPQGVAFVIISTGLHHSCGIREKDHGVECWGSSLNASAVPQHSEFLAMASGAAVTCGIREDNLLVDCWGNGTEFQAPLQLFSPGLCSERTCREGEFLFNATSLGVTIAGGLCSSPARKVCTPCARDCPNGTFLSSPCKPTINRQCIDCSMCQTSACNSLCRSLQQSQPPSLAPAHSKSSSSADDQKIKEVSLAVILGAAISGGIVVALVGSMILWWRGPPKLRNCRRRHPWGDRSDGHMLHNGSSGGGGGGGAVGGIEAGDLSSSTAIVMDLLHASSMNMMMINSGSGSNKVAGETQVFRLGELRDATNGFKEVNELGRGSYGFVYRGVLQDGRTVAVKRANAARRIAGSSRDFEAELEVLCKLRHCNIVNLIGYCGEMGERLLVYEFMQHGTLHDHLHGGKSPLSWGLRLRIAAQAARGIVYLHRDVTPQVIHRDIKSSNVLLDGEWVARIADFGIVAGKMKSDVESELGGEEGDVYSFGVVLLELVSGRKAHDGDYEPGDIVEWAAPLIQQGRGAVAELVIDKGVELATKNVELVLRMAEVAERCVRGKGEDRPSMPEVAAWLEQLAHSSGSL